MRIRSAWLAGLCASALAAEAAAFACDSNDPLCQPPPLDPCLAFPAPLDHAHCVAALPACGGLVGQPLQSCLTVAVQQNGAPLRTVTATSTSTTTSGSNRALNYQATMTNTSLFDGQVNQNSQAGNYTVQIDSAGTAPQVYDGGGSFLSQKDAFGAQSDMLFGCTATNLQGRSDGGCAANPNLPECTGMSAALGNATSCMQQSPPDPITGRTTCLKYGAYGFNLNEWLVFGQQYFNGMAGCFAVGDATDSTGGSVDPNKVVSRGNRLEALSDFAAFPPPSAGPAPTPNEAASTISGRLRRASAAEGGVAVRWKAVAEKVNDGAAYLGLDRGELVHRAASGQTFLSAFSDSPFAESLAKNERESVETALADPSETIHNAKEKALAQADGENGAGAGDAPPTLASESSPAEPAAASPNRGPASVGNGGLTAASLRAELGKAPDSAATEPTPAIAGRLAPVAVTIGAVGAPSDAAPAAASNSGGAANPAAAPAAVQAAPEFGSADSSLFERVSRFYRRQTRALKLYDESNTARDVRLTEKPAFFQDL